MRDRVWGFRVYVGFRVQGLGFGVQGLGSTGFVSAEQSRVVGV